MINITVNAVRTNALFHSRAFSICICILHSHDYLSGNNWQPTGLYAVYHLQHWACPSYRHRKHGLSVSTPTCHHQAASTISLRTCAFNDSISLSLTGTAEYCGFTCVGAFIPCFLNLGKGPIIYLRVFT